MSVIVQLYVQATVMAMVLVFVVFVNVILVGKFYLIVHVLKAVQIIVMEMVFVYVMELVSVFQDFLEVIVMQQLYVMLITALNVLHKLIVHGVLALLIVKTNISQKTVHQIIHF